MRPITLWAVVVLSVTACNGPVGPMNSGNFPGLSFEAATRLTDSSIYGSATTVLATLTVTNTADTTERVLWADCFVGGPVRLRAYASADPGRIAWDSNVAYQARLCDLVEHYQDVAPGRTWTYTAPVPVADILGDSLPPGGFAFTISAEYLQPSNPVPLPAGRLTLP